MQQARLVISGKVQGVFYRASCQDVAISYRLFGYAKNLPSGQVEVIAQGEKENIKRLIEWCKKGPPHAKVADVKVEWQSVQEQFSGFEVS